MFKTMWVFAFMLTISLSFSLNPSISNEIDGFYLIKDVAIHKDKIYILDYNNERINEYEYPTLSLVKKINVGRRYLRDILYYDGALYGIQSLGLYRIYPTREEIVEGLAGGSAFARDMDYFYVAHFTGYITKWKKGEKVAELRKIKGDDIEKLIDIITVGDYIFASSYHYIYVFDKNLSYKTKKYVPFIITGLSYNKGFVVITTKDYVYLYTPDFNYSLSFRNSFEDSSGKEIKISKVYLLGDGTIAGFTNSSFYLFNDSVEFPVDKIDRIKKEMTLDLDEVVNLSLMLNKYEYGNALAYLEKIKEFKEKKVEKNNTEQKEQNNNKKQEKVYERKESEYKDNSTLILVVISIFLIIMIMVFLLAYKVSKG